MDNDRMMIKIAKTEPRDLGLYIHIPFCEKKCDYCDFLSATATDEIKREYFTALLTEIKSYRHKTEGYIVPTIFFGGGTPSCVDAAYIQDIMGVVSDIFCIDRHRLEATIEVNPGTITEEKLIIYRQAGINRLSFGLQSADNHELKLLGRIHSYEQFEENYHLARKAGFKNINVDLMSALPGQTLQSWENTLNTVINLKPEHVSAYSLMIEEGTKFYDLYQDTNRSKMELPDEDTDRLIYHRTKEILETKGYYRYEISNYAKIGHECCHNSSYWIGTDYLGFGIGASSLLNGARYSNMQSIKQYIQLCKEFRNKQKQSKMHDVINEMHGNMNEDPIGIRRNYEILSTEDRMEEFMYLGLRMCAGVSKNGFFQRFGTEIETVYATIFEQLIKNNLLTIDGDMIRLTDFGIDISNTVLSDFLLN
jgi:oxygen-independent coproporphyrinogen-3 oxidase